MTNGELYEDECPCCESKLTLTSAQYHGVDPVPCKDPKCGHSVKPQSFDFAARAEIKRREAEAQA